MSYYTNFLSSHFLFSEFFSSRVVSKFRVTEIPTKAWKMDENSEWSDTGKDLKYSGRKDSDKFQCHVSSLGSQVASSLRSHFNRCSDEIYVNQSATKRLQLRLQPKLR